ncbi:MAG: HlyD family efflux transporter periplasmic adaptor subunit [Treponema sp.]|uniref:efflux RND transporter periplasmic adaptor subunit n=1 Tax=Treponema sp. TaxID=166 RepID=UPI0025CF5C4C|nr:HlyD family efflux transporter periplasmic adaptor subunit [Treponema sp.]MBQ9282936.1 HlyD family efflux transporter periplasmic adaptor subunit [Treponema sp.]
MKIKISKRKKILLSGLIALLLLLVILRISRGIAEKRAASSQTSYVVRKETYENVIQIAGTVAAAKSQTLKSLNDGTVVGVYKKEGDRVKAGDLIVQLDDTEQQYNLANLDYEISVARQNQTAGKIKLMETQRTSLVRKIADRKIVATFDGIIASLDVDPGDYLEAKDSIGTLVDTSYLTADVEVAETDVSKLKVGQKVDFTFPAYDGTVEGYLVSYPAIGEVTSRGATIVNAKVRIDDVPQGVLPNFSFTGKIQITEPEQKLVVERFAIGRDKGTAFAEIMNRDGSTTKVAVEVEPYGLEYVNVLSGLEGGEILKAQSDVSKSGRMSVSKKGQKAQKNNKNQQQQPPMGGMPPF